MVHMSSGKNMPWIIKLEFERNPVFKVAGLKALVGKNISIRLPVCQCLHSFNIYRDRWGLSLRPQISIYRGLYHRVI